METTIPIGGRAGLALSTGRETPRASDNALGRLLERPALAFGSPPPLLMDLLDCTRAGAALRTPIGVAASGPLWISLGQGSGAHCLVVQAQGAARADFLRTVALGLALGARPMHLQVVVIDLSGRELHPLGTLPHATGNTAEDGMAARMWLRWVEAEWNARTAEGRFWPRMLVVVDDLGSLMGLAPRSVSGMAELLLQRGAQAGIHFLAGVDPSAIGRVPKASPVFKLFPGAMPGAYRCRELARGEDFQAATVPVTDLDWVARGRPWNHRGDPPTGPHPGAGRLDARRSGG